VQVTVSNGTTPPPSGLVGAWSFDEGTGTAVADKSGRGNTGTVSGAAWTAAGRYGGALNFDGVNDWVTVPDHASLDTTGPLTLEAWVRPDTLGTWDTVVMKEGVGSFAYALYGTTEWAAPSGWARDAVAEAPQGLQALAWSHLAYTYDGLTSKLYVNGALVASTAAAFTLPNTAQPLRIGGNGVWATEFFDGLIDDVRVYNRPLSAAEVSADMAKGVGSTAAASAKVAPALRALPTAGAPDISLAEAPADLPRLKARRLRRTGSARGVGRHKQPTAGRTARTKRCGTSRKARRGASQRGSKAKKCKKPRGRRR
jgi:hypothetical protein